MCMKSGLPASLTLIHFFTIKDVLLLRGYASKLYKYYGILVFIWQSPIMWASSNTWVLSRVSGLIGYRRIANFHLNPNRNADCACECRFELIYSMSYTQDRSQVWESVCARAPAGARSARSACDTQGPWSMDGSRVTRARPLSRFPAFVETY